MILYLVLPCLQCQNLLDYIYCLYILRQAYFMKINIINKYIYKVFVILYKLIKYIIIIIYYIDHNERELYNIFPVVTSSMGYTWRGGSLIPTSNVSRDLLRFYQLALAICNVENDGRRGITNIPKNYTTTGSQVNQ